MVGRPGFWDFERSLEALSAEGDALERLPATVDFGMFRPELLRALRRCDPSKGGRPGFDPALKFKMLVLQALHGLPLQQTAYLVVRDRLSWLRFCGLRLGAEMPDPNTLWDAPEAPINAISIALTIVSLRYVSIFCLFFYLLKRLVYKYALLRSCFVA